MKIHSALLHPVVILLGIILVVFMTYIPLLQSGFIWDDEEFILGWKTIHTIQSIPQLMKGTLPEGHEGVYRPLRSITQLISYQLYGEQASLYHLQGIVIHLISTSVIFVLLYILTKKKAYSAIGSLFFGLHPLQTEAVSFITATFDTLGILWFFVSILFFVLYSTLRKHHSKSTFLFPIKLSQTYLHKQLPIFSLIISLFFASFAFFTTELTLSLPFIIIAFCIYYRQSLKQTILLVIPYVSLAGLYWLIRTDMISSIPRMSIDTNLFVTFLTMTKVVTEYTSRFFFPIPLKGITTIHTGIMNVYATPDALLNQSLTDPKTLLGIVLLLLFILCIYIARKKSRLMALGFIIIGLSFLPVSNIIPSQTLFAERYTYPAFFGIAIVISELIPFIRNILKKKRFLSILGSIGLILLFIFFAGRTYVRSREYRSPVLYWLSNLSYESSNIFVLNNLGLSFASLGLYQDAVKAFQAAINIDQSFVKAQFNISRVYGELGKMNEASLHGQKAFTLEPKVPDYIVNYSSILAKLGKGWEAQEVLATSSSKLRDSNVSYMLASISIILNDYETAEDALLKTLEIDPSDPKALIALGSLMNRKGTPDATIQLFEKATPRLDTKELRADYYYTFAVAQQKMLATESAKQSITQAFYANPDDSSIESLWNILILASPSSTKR